MPSHLANRIHDAPSATLNLSALFCAYKLRHDSLKRYHELIFHHCRLLENTLGQLKGNLSFGLGPSPDTIQRISKSLQMLNEMIESLGSGEKDTLFRLEQALTDLLRFTILLSRQV